MPDLSSITLPNNVTYNFKDEAARSAVTFDIFYIYVDDVDNIDDYYSIVDKNGDPIDRSNILESLENGRIPIIIIEDENERKIFAYPIVDSGLRSTEIRFLGLYKNYEYQISIWDDETDADINLHLIRHVPAPPNSNYSGKILTIDSNENIVWADLPVYNGGVS